MSEHPNLSAQAPLRQWDLPSAEAALASIVKAYDVRGVVGEQLSEQIAEAIGAALIEVLRADHAGEVSTVVVGYDMRPSSPGLAQAFARGVTRQGVDVINCGLCSTDQLYYASGALQAPGAMFTASHNPAQYNGIKMCRALAAPIGAETGLAQIRSIAASFLADGLPESAQRQGSVTSRDLLADYAAFVHRLVPLADARPLTVVVDAGNGMGGHTVPAVFSSLPFELTPLFFELDGTFPNHEANPIEPENLRDLQAKVREIGADVGLAFDGDADRCFVVDERGEIVSPSVITALIAVRELDKHPGASIIHNLITSRAVPEIVSEHGGTPVRTKVGHSFIKATMAQTGAVFGGEHSGHFYFADFWRADSGMLAALHVLAALAQAPAGTTLSQLLADYSRYVSSGEVNSTVHDTGAKLEQLAAHYRVQPEVTVDFLDGMTVMAPTWWFNVRPSNTEPLLRLNVEADDQATMEKVRDEALALIRQ